MIILLLSFIMIALSSAYFAINLSIAHLAFRGRRIYVNENHQNLVQEFSPRFHRLWVAQGVIYPLNVSKSYLEDSTRMSYLCII